MEFLSGTLLAQATATITGALLLAFGAPLWTVGIVFFTPLVLVLGIAVGFIIFTGEETDDER